MLKYKNKITASRGVVAKIALFFVTSPLHRNLYALSARLE